MTDRAQAHTLEAFAAALILVASVVFALQVTAVTPLTASTASQHIENQQGSVGQGLLDAAAENGTLKPTLLYWNNSSDCFHSSWKCQSYTSGGPPTEFGRSLNETFLDRGIAFNVRVWYLSEEQSLNSERMVNLGTPSDNAVSVRRTVTLHDDDRIRAADGSPSETVTEATNFYAPDTAPNSSVYNVLEVEVVIWRM